MAALLNSTIFRGMLGFVQVMGIVAVGAAAQLRSQLASGLSALAPAQRAGAQRLCALALLRHADDL